VAGTATGLGFAAFAFGLGFGFAGTTFAFAAAGAAFLRFAGTGFRTGACFALGAAESKELSAPEGSVR
jgi:hypothetical protein